MPTCSCPICKKSFEPTDYRPPFPFCSPRCRDVDLGKWLVEGYSVPVETERVRQQAREERYAPIPEEEQD